MSYSRNVVRSRFFGQPNLSMMIFQFLAYLSQKAIVQGFKTEKTLRLENGVPNPNIFQERSFPSFSVFHLLFFLQGVGKTQKPKTKVRASERPSVSRGWLQWLVYFLFLKIIALGASSLADFFTLRKCPLDSTLARGCTIFVD